MTPLNAATRAGGGLVSSFLDSVASTAAGATAGSFLFQGIENLLGHHSSGFAQQAFDGHIPELTVIDTYYDGDDAVSDGDYQPAETAAAILTITDSSSDWFCIRQVKQTACLFSRLADHHED